MVSEGRSELFKILSCLVETETLREHIGRNFAVVAPQSSRCVCGLQIRQSKATHKLRTDVTAFYKLQILPHMAVFHLWFLEIWVTFGEKYLKADTREAIKPRLAISILWSLRVTPKGTKHQPSYCNLSESSAWILIESAYVEL